MSTSLNRKEYFELLNEALDGKYNIGNLNDFEKQIKKTYLMLIARKLEKDLPDVEIRLGERGDLEIRDLALTIKVDDVVSYDDVLSQIKSLFAAGCCDDEAIKELNKQYRDKNEATDVLSFPIELENFIPEVRMLGDIVISTDTAKRQAEEFKHPVIVEIVILLIHGLLHLHGFDHIEEADRVVMRAKETEVFKHIVGLKQFPEISDVSSEPLIERASENA